MIKKHIFPSMALISLTALALVLSGCVSEEQKLKSALESITAEDLSRDVEILSSDEFEGRAPASKGEEKTIAFLKEEFLKLYGKDKILTVNDRHLTVSDGLGETSEELEYEDDAFFCMTELLKNFAVSILSPDTNKLCSSARENLQDMAVIESAYLSARTGFPEEPPKVLQMALGRTVEPTGI